jgi:hypothetical protein
MNSFKTRLYSKTYFWKTQRICWVFTWFIYNNKVSHPQSPIDLVQLFGWRLGRSSQKSEWGAWGCLRPWININQQRDSPYRPFLQIDCHVTCESNKKYIGYERFQLLNRRESRSSVCRFMQNWLRMVHRSPSYVWEN